MSKLIDQIKIQWEKNPMETIIVGALAAGTVAKLLDSMSAIQGRRAYAKQVDYRIKNKN